MWTFPDWSACSLRDALRGVYAAGGAQFGAGLPDAPASAPTRLAGDWTAEIDACGRFVDPQVTIHAWSQSYSSAPYVSCWGLTRTTSCWRPSSRSLLSAIAVVIEAQAGGVLTMPFVTRVCLATRR